jgi:hypothetical protein
MPHFSPIQPGVRSPRATRARSRRRRERPSNAITPGPWHLRRDDIEIEVWSSGPDPWRICTIDPGAGTTLRQEMEAPNAAESNARLIAAAPELLAHAKEDAKACASCNGDGMAKYPTPHDCEDCAELRALIARASRPLWVKTGSEG